MKSILKPKHVVWASVGLVVIALLFSTIHMVAKPKTQAQPAICELPRAASSDRVPTNHSACVRRCFGRLDWL